MRYRYLIAVVLAAAVTGVAWSHDVWLQTNVNLVRTGDAIHIDLMLGNHGNDHRDFKVAGKYASDQIKTFEVIDPQGKKFDLKSELADLGYAPKEGFLSARFVAATPGLYTASFTADRVVNHGKAVRSYRSAKAYFGVSDSLDRVSKNLTGFDKPLGHLIELVPEANPVAPMGPGQPIKMKLLFQGKPLSGTKVSFIPRGVALKEQFDSEYERTSDGKGQVSFTPRTGNYYLVVAHYPRDEKGSGFDSTLYTASVCILVPEKCPCCID
jgi:uncharacterized GH25 family protein